MKKLFILTFLLMGACSESEVDFRVDGQFLIIGNKAIAIPSITSIECQTFLRDRLIIMGDGDFVTVTYGKVMSYERCLPFRDKLLHAISGSGA